MNLKFINVPSPSEFNIHDCISLQSKVTKSNIFTHTQIAPIPKIDNSLSLTDTPVLHLEPPTQYFVVNYFSMSDRPFLYQQHKFVC